MSQAYWLDGRPFHGSGSNTSQAYWLDGQPLKFLALPAGDIKAINGVAFASVKTRNGAVIASTKTINGIIAN